MNHLLDKSIPIFIEEISYMMEEESLLRYKGMPYSLIINGSMASLGMGEIETDRI